MTGLDGTFFHGAHPAETSGYRPADDYHECLDYLAFTVVGATSLASREFAESELLAALDRKGLHGFITRFVIVRRDAGGGRVIVRLRISGDLHLNAGLHSVPHLYNEPPDGPKSPA